MMEVVLFVQDRRRVKNILLRVYRLQPNLVNVFLSFTGPVGEALRLHVYMYPASTFIIDKRVFLSEYPNYMKEMFGLCSVNYNLRGSNIFDLELFNFRYLSAKLWNSLLDKIRICREMNKFKGDVNCKF